MKTIKKETKGCNATLQPGKKFVNMLAMLPLLAMQSDLMAAKKITRSPMSQKQQAAYNTVVQTGINCNTEDSNSLQVQQGLVQAYVANIVYNSANGLFFNKNVTIGSGNSFTTDGEYYAHTEGLTTIDAQGSIAGVTSFFNLTVTPDTGTSVEIVGDIVVYGDLTLAPNTTLTIDGSLVVHGAFNLGAGATLELTAITANTNGSLYLLADSCAAQPITFGSGSSLRVVGNFVDYRSASLTIPADMTEFRVEGQTWTKGDMSIDADSTVVTFDGKVNVPSGSLYINVDATFGGGISTKNGVFVKAGVTASVLAGGLTVTGTGLTGDAVTVGSGATLQFASVAGANGIMVASGNVDVAGGVLTIGASSTLGIEITKGSLLVSGAGVVALGNTASGNVVIGTGNVQLSGTAVLQVNSGGIQVTTGTISVGTGTVLAVNAGGVTVTSGAVTVANNASVFGVNGGVTVTSGSFTVGTGVGTFVIIGAIAGTADVTINTEIITGITTIAAKTLTTSVNVTTTGAITTSGSVAVTDGKLKSGATLTIGVGNLAMSGDADVEVVGALAITTGSILDSGSGDLSAASIAITTGSITLSGSGAALTSAGSVAIGTGDISVGAGTAFTVTTGSAGVAIVITSGDLVVADGATLFSISTTALSITATNGDITFGDVATLTFTTADVLSAPAGTITFNKAAISGLNTITAQSLVVNQNVTTSGLVTVAGGNLSIATTKTLATAAGGFSYDGQDVAGTSFVNAGSLTATTGNIGIVNANNNAGVAVTTGTITTTTGTITISDNVSTSGDYGVEVNGPISSQSGSTAASLTFSANQGSVGVYFGGASAVNVGGIATFDGNQGSGDSATNIGVYFVTGATFNVYRGTAIPGTAILGISLISGADTYAFDSSNITLTGNVSTALTFANDDFGVLVTGVPKTTYALFTAASPSSAMILANKA